MFQKGAEVPGGDAEAVSREGQILRGESPRFPYWPVALDRALLYSGAMFPMGSAVKEGRKPYLNSLMVTGVVPQLGTLTGLSF